MGNMKEEPGRLLEEEVPNMHTQNENQDSQTFPLRLILRNQPHKKKKKRKVSFNSGL